MKLKEKLMMYMEINPNIPEGVKAYFRKKFSVEKAEGATT